MLGVWLQLIIMLWLPVCLDMCFSPLFSIALTVFLFLLSNTDSHFCILHMLYWLIDKDDNAGDGALVNPFVVDFMMTQRLLVFTPQTRGSTSLYISCFHVVGLHLLCLPVDHFSCLCDRCIVACSLRIRHRPQLVFCSLRAAQEVSG